METQLESRKRSLRKDADQIMAEVAQEKVAIQAIKDRLLKERRRPTKAESNRIALGLAAAKRLSADMNYLVRQFNQLPANEPLVGKEDVNWDGRKLGSGNGTTWEIRGMNRYATQYRSEDGPFETIGEQVQAIIQAGTPGERVDPRLFEIRAATGLNEGIPAEGGFLLQSDFSTEIYRLAFDTGVLAQRCARLPVGPNANGLKMPAVDETARTNGNRFGGVLSYWTGEAAQYQGTKPKFRLMELTLHKLTGLCYLTEELMQDAVALDAFVRMAFSEEIAFRTDDAIVRGTGAGMPLGFLNSGALVTVDKETGQLANSVVYENILSMWSRMPARYRRDCVWLINQDVEPQLFQMGLILGTSGSPVYMPPTGASQEPYSTLFGRPVIPIEYAETLGTVGDISLVSLANYLLIDKGGVAADSSIHLRFDYGETVLRFRYRVDGQPLVTSAVTPYKGADSLSPFVVPETRS